MESQGAAAKCQEIEGNLAFLILQCSTFNLRPCDICPTNITRINRTYNTEPKLVYLSVIYSCDCLCCVAILLTYSMWLALEPIELPNMPIHRNIGNEMKPIGVVCSFLLTGFL